MWWFRIAATLGRTVTELKQTMPLSEFTQWRHYYVKEPYGPGIENWRTAMTVANLMNATLKLNGRHAYKPDDFMPKFK